MARSGPDATPETPPMGVDTDKTTIDEPTKDENDGDTTHRRASQSGYGLSDTDVETAEAAPRSEKDPFEVCWNPSDTTDPMCPRSFSGARKWLIVSILASVSLAVTCASSIYSATYDKMEAEFHNSRIVSVLGLSSFVLGIGFGPMLLSPLSEFYGRRPIYLVAWATYIIWLVPQAVAHGVAVIIVFRFLGGFTGSAFLAVAGGTVGDLFSKDELQAPMAIFSVAPFVGPSLGPLLGGFINYNVDWRWTYYVLLIWSGFILVVIVFFVPETYRELQAPSKLGGVASLLWPRWCRLAGVLTLFLCLWRWLVVKDPILLRNKARKLRKETNDERWIAPTERVKKSVPRAIGRSLLRPFQLLIFEPMCLNLCILSALLLGILYLFFGAFPLIFGTAHGFNRWQTGLAFLGIMVSMVVGVATDPIWHHIRARLIMRHRRQTGLAEGSEPEFRLPPAIFGSVCVPAGLFMFGWSTYPWVHWIVPIIGSAIFGLGIMLLFTGIFTFLVDAYPQYAASALAANAFVRCIFAAAFPLFGNQMYKRLGYQWASSLLAFLTLVMMPFPYIFFRYGKRIRAKSRFASKS